MKPWLFFNVALVGFCAFAGLHHFHVWWLSRRERISLLFATYCWLSALVSAALVGIATATTVTGAQAALNARTTIAMITISVLAWLIPAVTGVTARRYSLFITAVLAVAVFLNLFIFPLSGTVTALVHEQTLWGEETTFLVRTREMPWVALGVYAAVLSVFAFGLVAGWDLRRRDRTAGVLVVLAGAGGLTASLFSLAIDLQFIRSPYFVPIPNLIWILLIAVLLSREYARRGHRIEASQQAVSISEARYRTLIESAPEAIVVFDLERDSFVEFNQQACMLFGVPGERLRALNPLVLSPPLQPDGRSSATAAAEYLRQAVAGATPVFEWTHRTPAGRDIPCEIRLVRLPDPTRVLVRGSITDISERLQFEEQLRESQKMQAIGQLAGGIAHDFNNLLTIITGYTELLLHQLDPRDPLRELAKTIGDASDRAASLTGRLLAFSRRAVLTPQIVDLNDAVGDAEQMLRSLIGENITLVVDRCGVRCPVEIDLGQWNQLIMNLAINARDAMSGGGRLTVGTALVEAYPRLQQQHPGLRAGQYVQLSVEDTGAGMTSEVKRRIFEPFFTTKDIGKGTGLGLAVVHGIVSQAGGCLEVDSELGAGTRFTLYLPAADDPGKSAHRDELASAPGSGETILVVEDEADLRDLVELALRSQGYGVLSAADGVEALSLLEGYEGPLHLLVTDMVMPNGLNGRELAARVRCRFDELKTLFMSGYLEDQTLRLAEFGDDQRFLQKPFSVTLLVQTARELLDGPSRQKTAS